MGRRSKPRRSTDGAAVSAQPAVEDREAEPATLFEAIMHMTPEEWDAICADERDNAD